MTPPSLSSEFQLPFEKGYIIPQKLNDLRGHFKKFEKGEEDDKESEDPGIHEEWRKRLKEIDPEGLERLKITFPDWYKPHGKPGKRNEYFCQAAGSQQWLDDFS